MHFGTCNIGFLYPGTTVGLDNALTQSLYIFLPEELLGNLSNIPSTVQLLMGNISATSHVTVKQYIFIKFRAVCIQARTVNINYVHEEPDLEKQVLQCNVGFT